MSQPESNLWGGNADDLGDAADILGAGLDIEPTAETPEAPEEPGIGEETPEPEVPEEVPAEEEPEPLEEEAPEEAEEAPEEETAEEEAARLWAGKYRSPEEMERGYNDMGRTVREHAARAAAAQRQLDELQQAVQNYVAQQPQQAPTPQAATMPDPTDAELAQWGVDRAGWNALKPLMERQAQAAVAPYIEQFTAQQQAQQQLTQEQFYAQQQEAESRRLTEAAMATVQAFYGDHPEFTPTTEEGMQANQALAAVIENWNMAWTGDPSGLAEGGFDPGDKDSLEIAAEALDRPMLANILATNPRYFDTEAGMTLARKQADLYEAAERTQTRGRQSKKALPAVESGSSGSGPRELETRPRDAIDEIVELTKKDKAKSVFTQ